jgi:catechol 2,3-dioxygenase-like lactoylglutathione lyase family enzyme
MGRGHGGQGMIRGIHHFGLTVRDVDASAAWYQDVLGFRQAGEFKAPDGARDCQPAVAPRRRMSWTKAVLDCV